MMSPSASSRYVTSVNVATGSAASFATFFPSGASPQPSYGGFAPCSHGSHPFAMRSSKGHVPSEPTGFVRFSTIAYCA